MPRTATKKSHDAEAELETLRKALLAQSAARQTEAEAETEAETAGERARKARADAADAVGKRVAADEAVVAATEAYGDALAAENA